MEGEKNEFRTPAVYNKGFSGVAPDTGQDRNEHQTLLLGAERVWHLGPRSLFSSFSVLSGLPFHPFSQENQYAREGSTWQKQGCPSSAQAHLSSRHILRYCTRKSMSKRHRRICSKKPNNIYIYIHTCSSSQNGPWRRLCLDLSSTELGPLHQSVPLLMI